MWHPPAQLRHVVPPARWPTAAEAAQSRWFSPLDTARLHLRERTWVPAMVPWRANEDGTVTSDVLDWYERFAQGRPGAIVVEATGIRDVPSGPLLRIGHDRFVPGLRQLVGRIADAIGGRTRVFVQLIDFLAVKRRPEREKFFRRFFEITDRHRDALRGRARTDDEIREALIAMSDEALAGVLRPRELENLPCGYRERVTAAATCPKRLLTGRIAVTMMPVV